MTRTIRNFVMAFAVAAGTAGAMAAPALADDWEHGRDWRAHEWREHHRYAYGLVAPYAVPYATPYAAPYAYDAPAYGYSGYVAPPPLAYAPPAAIFSLNIPFAFR